MYPSWLKVCAPGDSMLEGRRGSSFPVPHDSRELRAVTEEPGQGDNYVCMEPRRIDLY